jgi:ATP-dependent Clp protease protease subunit
MSKIPNFPKANSPWFAVKTVTEDSADLYFYDVIGDSWVGSDAATVVKEIKALKSKNLNVHISSPGGSVFDGIAIYNALISHPGEVTVYVDGLAASIASIIALAGKKVIIAENAMFMIHNPWTWTSGNAEELRKQADTLDQIGETLITTYASRTGKDRETIRKAMESETWFSAQEAKDWGLATDIVSALPLAASVRQDVAIALAFRNIPENLLVNNILEPSSPPSSETPRSLSLLKRKQALLEKITR